MSYRNKTYVAFNANYPLGKGDFNYYNLMLAWKNNDNIEFNFHNAHDLNSLTDRASDDQIYRKLKERMKNTKQFIILVGEHTKNMYKFVRWEITIALEMNVPIIAVNLDGRNSDTERTPPILKNEAYFVSVPFEMKKIKYALDNFPSEFYRPGSKAPSCRYYNWSNIRI